MITKFKNETNFKLSKPGFKPVTWISTSDLFLDIRKLKEILNLNLKNTDIPEKPNWNLGFLQSLFFNFIFNFIDIIDSIIDKSVLRDQCPNLMNLSRVSNPPKTGFNWASAQIL